MATSSAWAIVARTLRSFALIVAASACRGSDASAPTPHHRSASTGGRVVFTSARGGNLDIYSMAADGSEGPRRLTTHAAIDQSADWSPDRASIAFMSNRDGDYEIFVRTEHGMGIRPITTNADEDGFPRWSPDGSQLLFTSTREGSFELYVMRADGTNPIRLTRAVGDVVGGAWSPDGLRIAFTTDRDGDDEIYLMNVDGTGLVRLTNSAALDVLDAWRR